jgi:hypothetical protein
METFENMTFMEVFSRPSEDQNPILLEPVGKLLPVLEPLAGNFWLFLPKELLIGIAENVYVMETDEIEQQILQDTLAELLNTIAGKIMQEALSEDQLFSLGLPEPAEEVSIKPDETLNKWFFEVQEALFYVAFTGEELPC